MKEAKEHKIFCTSSIQDESMSSLPLSNPRLGGFYKSIELQQLQEQLGKA